MSIEDLEAEALKLDPKARARLAGKLLESLEGLSEEAPRSPDRSPDIGEPSLHPTAGATAVGARKFVPNKYEPP